ncbi:hypothetical protein SNE40_020593 [Patella caerulea]|uniref:Uncharacterized protein n=1 Tax=Patella caerulea TaxID=87958 RepID=A0AAN8PFV0_PATCE
MGQKQISEEDHNRPDHTVNSSGRPEHDYTGLVNLNGPDTVNKSGPEHDYTDLVNRNGSDTSNKSELEHSAVPNETEHDDITTSNPTQVRTESSTYDNSKNTITNENEQHAKDNAYLRIID